MGDAIASINKPLYLVLPPPARPYCGGNILPNIKTKSPEVLGNGIDSCIATVQLAPRSERVSNYAKLDCIPGRESTRQKSRGLIVQLPREPLEFRGHD